MSVDELLRDALDAALVDRVGDSYTDSAIRATLKQKLLWAIADVLATLDSGPHVDTVPPTVTDDSSAGYVVGDRWVDTVGQNTYTLVDASAGAAVWVQEDGSGGGGGAPTNAQYITAASNGSLSAERVATNTGDIEWDFATGGQAKANVTAAYTADVLADAATASESYTDGIMVSHLVAADPHTAYQKESEKGVANGYASLDASALVPVAQLPAGVGGGTTRYFPDVIPSGTSLVAPSCEFQAAQTTGSFTSSWDLGTVVSAAGLDDLGAWIETNGLGTAAALGGLYSSTFPSGDWAMLAKMTVEGNGTAGGGGIGLIQGTGATDDVYFMGTYSTGYPSLDMRAWISYFTAYNTPGADIVYQSIGPPLYIGVRYEASGHRIQTWMGRSPQTLALVDPNRTLTNAPTAIALLARRVSGAQRLIRSTCEWIRFRADTYDAAVTAVPPRDLAGELL